MCISEFWIPTMFHGQNIDFHIINFKHSLRTHKSIKGDNIHKFCILLSDKHICLISAS